MRRVEVRHPGVSVVLHKNVGRTTLNGSTPVSERYAGRKQTIDLTRYLGDQGSVRVVKSVREPAGGFTVTFPDQHDQEGGDTVYGLVEPMDLIEIRMAADAFKHPRPSRDSVAPRTYPIMMRGFVSSVSRVQSMGGDGKPQRAVTISGQDYGKIWQIVQVFLMPHIPPDDGGASLLTSFPFFALYGLEFSAMPVSQFLKEVVENVLNRYLKEMEALGFGDELRALGLDIQVTGSLDGTVPAQSIGSWQGGAIYNLLRDYCDVGAWNELFIEDREDRPYVVFRPNPFLDPDGRYIMPLVAEPEFVDIGREDVVSMTVSRSDANVANYFWVDTSHFNMNFTESLRAAAFDDEPQTFFVEDYGNVNPKLYGTRKMWEQTALGGVGQESSGNGLPDGEERNAVEQSWIDWMRSRRLQLIDLNKDNVIFETGSMRLRGNEQIRAGRYVRLREGRERDRSSLYYAVSVQHEFVPFSGYFTTVEFERGTGFIERAKLSGGPASPYWSELAGG